VVKGQKVVIDVNIFISAFGWGGKPLKVMELLERGEIKNCISEEIVKELCTAIAYHKLAFPKKLQTDILEFVLAYSDIHEPAEHLNIASDANDNKFVECALSANARFVITGDKGLLSLNQFRGIKIITAEEFLKMGR